MTPRQYETFTREQELELHRSWKENDDQSARTKLIESQIAWAKSIVHKFARYDQRADRDDAEGTAMLGVLKAVAIFAPDRGHRLSTLVYHCVRTAVWRMERGGAIRIPPGDHDREAAALARRSVSLAECRVDGAPWEPTYYEPPLNRLERQELAVLVSAAVSELPEREARVLRRRYWEGLSRPQMVAEFGVGKARLGQLEQRSLGRLSERLAGCGI